MYNYDLQNPENTDFENLWTWKNTLDHSLIYNSE